MEEHMKGLNAFCEIDTDKSFRQMTTLRIGGNVKYVAYPKNVVALDGLMRYIKEKELPYKMLGKGSDLLCSDKDYDGVVIRLDRHFAETYFDGTTIVAQAGCSIIALAVNAMQEGLSGLEFASGIPGTLGGAIFMNAGAYKSSISEVLTEVLVYRDGQFVWMKKEECEFSYRSSIFQKHPDWIILAARLSMQKSEVEEIRSLMENRRERRMASQPLDKPSCGSVFRNPENENAWALIDGIGYRGMKCGDAEVSTKHCNFIVNNGNASADDYANLVAQIQDKVKEKYGIELHTEMEKFNW